MSHQGESGRNREGIRKAKNGSASLKLGEGLGSERFERQGGECKSFKKKKTRSKGARMGVGA